MLFRSEVVECNCGVLVGSDINKIKKNFYKEIKDENINLFSNPFGNGDSAIKILDIIENEN